MRQTATDPSIATCIRRAHCARILSFSCVCLLVSASFLFALSACAQEKEELSVNPTRPTVANSASISSPHVLQIEIGYDAYPQTPPGEQQTVSTSIFYTPTKHIRLDFSISPFSRVQSVDQQATGVGTIQIGTKVMFLRDKSHGRWPGIGLQYEAELPTASDDALQNRGQQAIVLVNHHYGPVDVILNGSVVETDCGSSTGCTVGGQQAVALTYHVTKPTALYAETFAQNVSQSNTPPGTYVFGGFLHKFSEGFGINGGLRFGVSNHSATIGTTVGVLFGRQIGAGATRPAH